MKRLTSNKKRMKLGKKAEEKRGVRGPGGRSQEMADYAWRDYGTRRAIPTIGTSWSVPQCFFLFFPSILTRLHGSLWFLPGPRFCSFFILLHDPITVDLANPDFGPCFLPACKPSSRRSGAMSVHYLKRGGYSPLTRLVQLYFVLYFSFLFLLLFVQRSVTLQEKPVMGIVASNHRTRQTPAFRPLDERTISPPSPGLLISYDEHVRFAGNLKLRSR